MKEYPAQVVAATYMAIAMRLYKTHLEDDAYKKMIETVMETEVKPYNPKKVLNYWDDQVIVLIPGFLLLMLQETESKNPKNIFLSPFFGKLPTTLFQNM